MNAIAPFLDLNTWIEILDGDDEARALFDRHYSRNPARDKKPAVGQAKLILGPGQKLLPTTPSRLAIFAWRKFIDDSGQEGVNCAVFRNEGAGLSSALVRAADVIADRRWPGERHYTFVDPKRIRSSNPGCCFIKAGWQRCGVTKKRGLIILERIP